MAINKKLRQPWLIAVWPGMGQVAISAGYYLLAKLEMEVFAELSPQGLFEMEHVEVRGGLIRPGQLPRSRFFSGATRRASGTSLSFSAKRNRHEKSMPCVASW